MPRLISKQRGTPPTAPPTPVAAIRSAGVDDLDAVVALAESWQASDPTWKDGKDGFLVSAYGRDVYNELLSRAKYFLVAVEGDRVVGFLVA